MFVYLFIGCNLNAIKAATIAAIPVAIKKNMPYPCICKNFFYDIISITAMI